MSEKRRAGMVVRVIMTPAADAHFKARVRFAKARPWVHFAPALDEDAARALATQLGQTARTGHAIEWVAEGGARGHWRPLVELADGAIVDVNERHADPARALVRAQSLAHTARVDRVTSETRADAKPFGKWCDAWLDAKRAKVQRVAAVSSHLRTHIVPAFGAARDPQTITKRDIEKLVQRLDDLVASGKLRWKSAINIWGTLTKLFDDMTRGKVLELRAREDNPCKEVRGPDRGVDTEKVHLFPHEFLALVECDEVPLLRRRYYAVAIYNYLRPGELEALRWDDVDLVRSTIQIRRSMDRESGGTKAPKAGKARSPFDLEPAIVPLLEAMHAESGGEGRVFGDLGDERELADKLRADLITAGVERHELHHMSESHESPREWMTMHDCRTTGVTWMAVRGDTPYAIMARAGHADLKTSQHYVNTASLISRGYGQPFPPLPGALLGSGRSDQTRTKAAASSRNRDRIGGSAWESNPPAAP